MAQHYKQLSMEEREIIQSGLWNGRSQRAIAYELGRSPATLSRELRRNSVPSYKAPRYLPRIADKKAHARIMTRATRPRLKSDLIRTYTHEKLREGWSPEQIAGRIRLEHRLHISHEAIYQYIYAQYYRGGNGRCTGSDLRVLLRRRHRIRHRKNVPYIIEKGSLHNRISIDQRPAVVGARTQPGHWEGDSMVSRKSPAGLNTLVERMSGLAMISKLPNGKSYETTRAVVRRLQRIPRPLRRTLTLDNGFENAGHQEMASQTKMSIYFAHPYHSWERGTNENTNGLIRWYLPKKTDFEMIPETTIAAIEYQLNTRPRKRLHWRTPLEVFNSFVLH